MGQKYLIDTCTVVKYLDEVLPPEAILFMDALVDDDCKVSFITKIELLVWNPPIAEDIIVREEFLAGSETHYINDEIINGAIQIRKTTHIRLPDAVIAATAIHNDYVLLSTNDNDFIKVIPLGLKYMNPETAF
ncbi:MAG: type II toxin-antitoxin system VapC family toxin [Bacteroidales bacterium]|nr:type II toxin-antitoxin system VapC family toxin [Bacteroidales bacterium]MDD4576171.1 type II toxin-antitoxin system VapC family toxin [Bacteroidales bacterium]